MHTGVIVDDYIHDGNSKPYAADNDLDREWGPEDFVLDKETKDDEPWDRDNEVFADIKLTCVVDVRELIDVGKNWGRCLIQSHGFQLISQMNEILLKL